MIRTKIKISCAGTPMKRINLCMSHVTKIDITKLIEKSYHGRVHNPV